jgi:CheY-like chemotaxis protein
MSIRDAIAPELPYLRRYARSITGSQQFGDAAIRQMLEALLADPAVFDPGRPARIELFRMFHKLWSGPQHSAVPTPAPTSRLDLAARQALMLTAVEGFGIEDTAHILDQPVDAVTDALGHARAMIDTLLQSRILVIEDEMVIALHIQSVVETMGHSVVGIAATAAEAIAMAHEHRPDLILADINLGEGPSGVDAAKDILDDFDVPVIFVTAYPERLLTGERPEPTYLITKPFEPSVLGATAAQALMFHREGSAIDTVPVG